MRRDIYTALRRLIRQEIPEIKHLGLWNENMEELSGGLLFDTPAVFVEFAPVTFTGSGQGIPRAPMEIILHLVHKYTPEDPHQELEDGSYDRPDYLDDPLDYLDLLEQLETAPIGLSGNHFSGLQLVSSDLDHQHGELMHHLVTFVTGVGYPSSMAVRDRYRKAPALQVGIKQG